MQTGRRKQPEPGAQTMSATAQIARTQEPSDYETLADLNREYIASVQNSDVIRFNEILAEDFLCSNPDGSLLDRAAFLAQTAKPVTIRNLAAHDVVIRLMGDVAIIHARTSYTTADGRTGGGRYTDGWARRDGRWLAVFAHVTRV
jgi:ketosteroid isomerase-like protein